MNKMKIFLGIAAMSLLAACNSRPVNGYTVKGHVDGLDGEEIYMLRMITSDSTSVDTAVVTNGAFEFNGVADLPMRALVFKGSLNDRENKTVAQFYLEAADITIENLKGGDFTGAKFTGSKTTDDMMAYQEKQDLLYSEMKDLRDAMQANPDNKELTDSLEKKMEDVRNRMTEVQHTFIAENPGSFYTPVLLEMTMSHMSFDELKAAYEALNPEVQAAATEVKAELDALASIQPGMPAPDLVGVNHKGEPEKLSDLKGNVVLVDFWATWCGPCRASLPHINELYKKYHDKGFEVFCVGDNDSNPDEWKKFIEENKDGMPNYHHILRGMKTLTDANGNFTGFDRSNDQSDKYAVHYLPTKYLIAADGTIIGKFDDSEAMDAKLAEIFE